jgi:predicted amidohydrolase
MGGQVCDRALLSLPVVCPSPCNSTIKVAWLLAKLRYVNCCSKSAVTSGTQIGLSNLIADSSLSLNVTQVMLNVRRLRSFNHIMVRISEISIAVAQSIAVPGDVVRSVDDHVRLAKDAADRGARLVLFPELSLTGYDRHLTLTDAVTTTDPRLQPLQALADGRDLVIIAGAPVVSERGLHIGAFCFLPGLGLVTYLKQHLHEGEETAFVPGDGGDAMRIGGQVVCVAICADITHAEHACAAAARGADIYAASCFITPGGYGTDSELLAGYAREHRMTVLMANYGSVTSEWPSAGRSAIWSNTGALLACGPSEGESVVVAKHIQRT